MKRPFFFLFFCAPAVLGQSAVLSDRIVVTASSVAETIESTPAAVTILTREDIDAREAHDVADVLREVPGLSVARTGSPGKSTTLFIRGGSSKQALVMWNGVEINNSYFSGYNFGQLSTLGVEKVEVVRGPYSALYGSDAVSGVINVLTSPLRDSLRVEAEGGENRFRSVAASGAVVRALWSAHGSIERRSDDGFAANDDFTSESWMAGAQVMPGKGFSAGILARRNGYDLGIPRNVNATFTEFVPTPNRREEGSERQIVIPVRVETPRARFELRLSDNRRQERFNDPDAPFGVEAAFTDAVTRSARGTAQSARTALGSITAGAEWERSEVDHTDTFGLDVRSRSRRSESVFVEDRFSGTIRRGLSIEIAAGLRYDRYDTFGAELSPRLGFALVEHNRKWRAAYGEGFRAPAIGELYAPFFGNAELDAERSRNIEVGFDQYLRAATVSLTLFRSDYDDLITFDGRTSRFGNIAAARAQGLEVGATRRLGQLQIGLSFTRLKAVDVATGEQLVRRPKNSGSVSLHYGAGRAGIGLVITHTGARPDVTDLVPFGNVMNEEHTTADVAVSYELGNLRPFAKIENLTDERYEEVFGYPSARRRMIAGLRYILQ